VPGLAHRRKLLPSFMFKQSFVVDYNRRIGHGANSSVYVGWERVTKKMVAMKLFPRDDLGRLAYRGEAEVCAVLPQHDALPRFLGKGKLKDHYFIAMELIKWPTLAAHIKRQGPLSEEQATTVIRQLLEVLELLARVRIAHRDVKPANILVEPSTLRITLIDFGLSTFVSEGEATTDNVFVGTPIYMAPQVLAITPYKVISADIWSAGVTLLELLLGKNPFAHAKTLDELQELAADKPDVTSSAPRLQPLLLALMDGDERTRCTSGEWRLYLEDSFIAALSNRRTSQDRNLAEEPQHDALQQGGVASSCGAEDQCLGLPVEKQGHRLARSLGDSAAKTNPMRITIRS